MLKLKKCHLFCVSICLLIIVLVVDRFFWSSATSLNEDQEFKMAGNSSSDSFVTNEDIPVPMPDDSVPDFTLLDTNSSDPSTPAFLTKNQTFNPTSGSPICPDVPPNLSGRVKIRLEAPPMEELEEVFRTRVQLGGRYSPSDCRSRHRVAIIVPFMNREEHLPVFLQHMHDFLPRQQIDYTIYVVEQAGQGLFNKGIIMNTGVIEALKQDDFQCFIFHDIDLLPEDDRNIYSCPEQPRHMSVAVNTFKYKLPYKNLIGGVSAMSRNHIEKVNGFSNLFWGWGGEDDDMSNRIKYRHLNISRYPASIARYTMLPHKKAKPNPKRFRVLRNGARRSRTDGLSSLQSKVLKLELKPLYTWILVDIRSS